MCHMQPVSLIPARLLILGISTILLTGCTVGLRRETRIVYASIAATPEELDGLIRVATNAQIPVTVGQGEDAVSTTVNAGGYYLVSAADLKTMIAALRSEGQRENPHD